MIQLAEASRALWHLAAAEAQLAFPVSKAQICYQSVARLPTQSAAAAACPAAWHTVCPCLPAGIPVMASTPQSSHRRTTGPLTFSEYSLDCFLYTIPAGASHCQGGQGGQTYPRMFFIFYFALGPYSAVEQHSKLSAAGGPMATESFGRSGNRVANKAYSFSCNLYADNKYFCFNNLPDPSAQLAASITMQMLYQASASSTTRAAAAVGKVPAGQGPLPLRRGFPVMRGGRTPAVPVAADHMLGIDSVSDNPRWTVQCYVSADGTLNCQQLSGGQGTPAAHVHLGVTVLGASVPAASDTGESLRGHGGGGAAPANAVGTLNSA